MYALSTAAAAAVMAPPLMHEAAPPVIVEVPKDRPGQPKRQRRKHNEIIEPASVDRKQAFVT